MIQTTDKSKLTAGPEDFKIKRFDYILPNASDIRIVAMILFSHYLALL